MIGLEGFSSRDSTCMRRSEREREREKYTVVRRSITEYNPRDKSRMHVRESMKAGLNMRIHGAS